MDSFIRPLHLTDEHEHGCWVDDNGMEYHTHVTCCEYDRNIMFDGDGFKAYIKTSGLGYDEDGHEVETEEVRKILDTRSASQIVAHLLEECHQAHGDSFHIQIPLLMAYERYVNAPDIRDVIVNLYFGDLTEFGFKVDFQYTITKV